MKFRYTHGEPRTFHAFGELEPGDVVEADENPDGHFFELEEPKAEKSKSAKGEGA